MDRRAFLVRTLGVVLASRLAPVLPAELPLPEPTFYRGLNMAELNETTLRWILPAIREDFFRNDPLLSYLKDK